MEPDPEEGEKSLRPIHINTFALPRDDAVRLAYDIYNPSPESLLLKSEKGRAIFAEAFITNPNLGTLSDLCVRALAQHYGTNSLDIGAKSSLMRRLQYDAIDIDQPLEDIYQIEDWKFWKRVALAKTVDARLKLNKDDYDWKSEGVTLKYLELVEQCPAEFWPEAKMCDLAKKIKNNVKDMNIRKLQALQEFSFAHYCGRDSDTDKTTSTDISDTTEDEVELEPPQDLEEEAEEEQSERDAKSKSSRKTEILSAASSTRQSQWSFLQQKVKENEDDAIEAERLISKVAKQTELRREERRKRRESQQKRRKLREEKRLKRDEELNRPKPKRIRIHDIFSLPIDEPQNNEHKKQDSRNIESYLKFKKKNIYTPDRCHHIDLSFLRHFDQLVSLQIKFQPPELKMKYHTRYFNFSHDDIKNLANGIAPLQNLRIFRLRDSRMDEQKLATLVFALNQSNVEVIDFGNDQLDEDCEIALQELFQNTTTIKSLELEGNKLGAIAMNSLGRAIQNYPGKLEYLGLARNIMDAEGLHALIGKIANTKQIEALCLAGVQIPEISMLCCIADELLHRHKVLRHLDIMAVPLSVRSGEILIKGMKNNYSVVYLDCRGCNLSESLEMEIEICVQRNRYKAENSYIGQKAKTEAEITEFLNRIKNPILLAANKCIEKKEACLLSRPDIAQVHTGETPSSESTSASSFYDLGLMYRPTVPLTALLIEDKPEAPESMSSFIYDVMDFDMISFHQHVHIPGPTNRYYYMKAKKSRNCQNID